MYLQTERKEQKKQKLTHLFLDVFINVHLNLEYHVEIDYLLLNWTFSKWIKNGFIKTWIQLLKDAVKMHFVLSIHNQSLWQDHTKQINFMCKIFNEKMF